MPTSHEIEFDIREKPMYTNNTQQEKMAPEVLFLLVLHNLPVYLYFSLFSVLYLQPVPPRPLDRFPPLRNQLVLNDFFQFRQHLHGYHSLECDRNESDKKHIIITRGMTTIAGIILSNNDNDNNKQNTKTTASEPRNGQRCKSNV